jgi:dienelactone hydrolase
MPNYRHLGVFSDLADAAARSHSFLPFAPPGPETLAKVRAALSFAPGPETPADPKVERTWKRDGIHGEEVSWSVGYGPRTKAYLLRPADASGPLPGVLALHDHGGFKYMGREKIADGPDGMPEEVRGLRERLYSGRAFANDLARRGFVVLVPDVFLWGSRGFSLETMTAALGQGDRTAREEVTRYNELAGRHEPVVEKYLRVLGTTLSGVISFEDRIAARYLTSRPEVRAGGIGCVGLSGGGLRAGLLHATADPIRASVVVGMMSTYSGLLDHNVVSHTWMLYPGDWSRHGDYPDLVACRAPLPLLVQYDRDDSLFTMEGMQGAHERLQRCYATAGAPKAYTGQFYPGPHKFDTEMQEAAFAWLKQELRAG